MDSKLLDNIESPLRMYIETISQNIRSTNFLI